MFGSGTRKVARSGFGRREVERWKVIWLVSGTREAEETAFAWLLFGTCAKFAKTVFASGFASRKAEMLEFARRKAEH